MNNIASAHFFLLNTNKVACSQRFLSLCKSRIITMIRIPSVFAGVTKTCLSLLRIKDTVVK